MTFVDDGPRVDGIVNMFLHLLPACIRGADSLPEEDVAAWQAEQRARAAGGGFHFHLTHVVQAARRL